jgi:hypothetical protein
MRQAAARARAASSRAATAHTAASGTLTPIRWSRPAQDEIAPVKKTTSTAAVTRLAPTSGQRSGLHRGSPRNLRASSSGATIRAT